MLIPNKNVSSAVQNKLLIVGLYVCATQQPNDVDDDKNKDNKLLMSL